MRLATLLALAALFTAPSVRGDDDDDNGGKSCKGHVQMIETLNLSQAIRILGVAGVAGAAARIHVVRARKPQQDPAAVAIAETLALDLIPIPKTATQV